MNALLIIRIARFYSLEFLTYPLETVALILRRVSTVGLLLLFWHLIARDNEISKLQIVPYILIATGTHYLSVGQNFLQAHEISEDIRHGRLNNLLIRPVGELLYEMGTYLGKNVLELVFSVANIAIGLLLVSELSGSRLLLFAVSLIPCVLIGYALNIAVAAAAFWMTDTTHFRLMTFFILRVISGLWLPLTFFAGWVGTSLQYAPFAQLAFVPSYVINGDDLGRATMFVVVGFLQAPIAILLARALWRRGLREYGAVGI